MIIGIGHKKNMGKDTFAKAFKSYAWWRLGKKSEIKSFSDALFQAGHILFGWAGARPAEDYEKDYTLKAKELPGLPGVLHRDIAKAMGDACRAIHPDALILNVVCSVPKDKLAIITNVRFPNEAKTIRESGGLLFKITRPSIEIDKDDKFDTALDEWTDWDEQILNDKTIAHLNDKAGQLVTKYSERFCSNVT